MTIENSSTVDIVATGPAKDRTRLVISDHLLWEDPVGHLTKLKDKLNTYLAFIETGQLFHQYPDAAGKPVNIEIAFLHAPPSEAHQFLEDAAAIVAKAGFDLTWRAHAV